MSGDLRPHAKYDLSGAGARQLRSSQEPHRQCRVQEISSEAGRRTAGRRLWNAERPGQYHHQQSLRYGGISRADGQPAFGNDIVQNPQFENLGHAYSIAYSNIISLIASVSDRAFSIIPHPKEWSEPFRKLRDAKEEGYYYDSPISFYPIGAYEIFEGQARMAQLQYLHFATGGLLGMEAAEHTGMFNGVYGKAFADFLQLTELERPPSIDHPTIGLFLLICDVALNPGSGFPFPLVHYPSFIRDIEPGARFVWLCGLARLKHPEVVDAIREYSREEYDAVSRKLCAAMVEHPPLEIAGEFSRWAALPEFAPLMSEHAAFRFEKSNVAVRIIFAHFLAFMRDKFARPEFFC